MNTVNISLEKVLNYDKIPNIMSEQFNKYDPYMILSDQDIIKIIDYTQEDPIVDTSSKIINVTINTLCHSMQYLSFIQKSVTALNKYASHSLEKMMLRNQIKRLYLKQSSFRMELAITAVYTTNTSINVAEAVLSEQGWTSLPKVIAKTLKCRSFLQAVWETANDKNIYAYVQKNVTKSIFVLILHYILFTKKNTNESKSAINEITYWLNEDVYHYLSFISHEFPYILEPFHQKTIKQCFEKKKEICEILRELNDEELVENFSDIKLKED